MGLAVRELAVRELVVRELTAGIPTESQAVVALETRGPAGQREPTAASLGPRLATRRVRAVAGAVAVGWRPRPPRRSRPVCSSFSDWERSSLGETAGLREWPAPCAPAAPC